MPELSHRRGAGWLLRLLIVGALAAIVALTFSFFDSDKPTGANAAEILASVPETPVTEALLELPAPAGAPPPYQRDEFGPAWADTDHNGCDTRNDILARDMENVVYKDGTRDCVVLRGSLDDPYTGQNIRFQRGQGTSQEVQIDHVVALSDAWKSGAWQWDAQRRQQFANDPLNLLAVDGPANQQKSAFAADQWLPSNSAAHCDFAARQIAVKNEWDLGVTEPERTALAAVIANCGAQELPLE